MRTDGSGRIGGGHGLLAGSAPHAAEAPLFASVTLGTTGQRELCLSPVPTMLPVLCRCTPSADSCEVSDGKLNMPCSQLDIRDGDGKFWGSIVPTGSDSYCVVRNGRQVLFVEGVQEVGRLLIFAAGAEPLAHAARVVQNDVAMLEVGVKPQVDPILSLIVILGVVIFNPEERCPTPLPSVGDMCRSFSTPQRSIAPSDPRPFAR